MNEYMSSGILSILLCVYYDVVSHLNTCVSKFVIEPLSTVYLQEPANLVFPNVFSQWNASSNPILQSLNARVSQYTFSPPVFYVDTDKQQIILFGRYTRSFVLYS